MQFEHRLQFVDGQQCGHVVAQHRGVFRGELGLAGLEVQVVEPRAGGLKDQVEPLLAFERLLLMLRARFHASVSRCGRCLLIQQEMVMGGR